MKSLPILILILVAPLLIIQASPSSHHPLKPTPERDADSLHNWNALHYDLQLRVTPISDSEAVYLNGNVTIQLTPEISNLDLVDLHFVGLSVDSVKLASIPCTWTREDCLLYVALPRPYNPEDTLNLTIQYRGIPVNPGGLLGGVGIFYPDPLMIYTMADPRGLRYWVPSWDEPWDKATSRQRLEFPDSFMVVANGEWEDTLSVGSGFKRWTYSMDQPIATYLVSFCASNYDTLCQSVGSVSLTHYVRPYQMGAAQICLQPIPDMILTYNQFFGLYPFSTFGYASAPLNGGNASMENQTIVTTGSGWFTSSSIYEDYFAHELSHQWFGDAVSYLDWPDMWLSEGFATYAEALWHQHRYGVYGMQGYLQTMIGIQSAYKGWESPQNNPDQRPMGNPPMDDLWTALTYEKGASLLHMLRYEVADSSLFFQILQNYYQSFKYGNATTWDLANIVQQYTGEDYDWLFQQWVYQPGYPTFEYFATTQPQGAQTLLTLSVGQSQPAAYGFYRTEADLSVITNGDSTIHRLTIQAQASQEIQLTLPAPPDEILLDPFSWILCTKIRRDDIVAPILADTNALITDAGGDGFLDPGESGTLSFTILNSGAPTPALTIELTSLDPGLTITNPNRTISALPFWGQHDFTTDPFPVTNASGTPPRWTPFQVQVDEVSTGDSLTTLWFSLPVGSPEILLVDDDGGGNSQIKHQQALNAIGRVFRTVTYVSANLLPPLSDYRTVVWACGSQLSNTLTLEDQALVQAYLNSGGSFFLSGRGVVPDLAANDFLQNTFHAAPSGTTDNSLILGLEPLLTDLTFLISGDQTYTHEIIEPDNTPGAIRLLNYSAPIMGAAVRYEGGYKSCILGFALDDVADNTPFNKPADLLGPVMEWMTGTVGVQSGEKGLIPWAFGLEQNFPNPFNAATVIRYQMPDARQVSLKLYDTAGRLVATLVDGWRAAGSHELTFEAGNLPSGMYFCRLKAGDYRSVRKMLLVK